MDALPPPSNMELSGPPPEDSYLTVEDLQRQLRRSRASIYRYANTDPEVINPPFDPQKLNPEVRSHREDPIVFHIREVRRFARDVLGLFPTIAVQASPESTTHALLREILAELKHIRQHLEGQNLPPQ
ncbi:MAG: resolvase [Cyanobacteria bacterium]|nr:resolvase [Cyanobacteriota bacterium]